MINFLDETIEMIYSNGQDIHNILFIGKVKEARNCNWQFFKEIANIDYDNGFGGCKISLDLEIVFKDGSRSVRREYDGSECWEYQDVFSLPKKTIRLLTVLEH